MRMELFYSVDIFCWNLPTWYNDFVKAVNTVAIKSYHDSQSSAAVEFSLNDIYQSVFKNVLHNIFPATSIGFCWSYISLVHRSELQHEDSS